jgi:hypothetical protein
LQDEVDLQVAPRGHIPMVRLHRDQVLQEHKSGRVAPYRRRLTAFLRACSRHQSGAG